MSIILDKMDVFLSLKHSRLLMNEIIIMTND